MINSFFSHVFSRRNRPLDLETSRFVVPTVVLDSKHAMFWSENILRFGLPLYFGFELIANTKSIKKNWGRHTMSMRSALQVVYPDLIIPPTTSIMWQSPEVTDPRLWCLVFTLEGVSLANVEGPLDGILRGMCSQYGLIRSHPERREGRSSSS